MDDDDDMSFDFMEEIFGAGCWLETTDQYSTDFQTSSPISGAINYIPPLENNHLILDPNQNNNEEAIEKLNLPDNPPLWIGPSPTVDFSPSSIKNRLMQAITYLKDSTKDRNTLIQIWVPVRRDGKNVLTTTGQPFSFDPNCQGLEHYRNVSENYQFPVEEEDSKDYIGLPGRVYLAKVPEWTPDVRLFKSVEYPRINYAQQYNVQGSFALPVFERGSGTCLGVVEIVTTSQKINYRPELEDVCKALEAVDLRSSEISSPSNIKACDELYQTALPDIIDVLTSVCETLKLPLAQTWAPCIQLIEGDCSNFDTSHCFVSTIKSAFYASDQKYLEFHEECSEHNLLKDQGIVGRAFTTNEPCFVADVTAYTKTEYPLSHLVKMFDLCAAVAIRLRSVHTGSAEFVLEFFLPTNCLSIEDQQQMLRSLSFALKQAGQNLRTLTGNELDEEVLLSGKEEVQQNGKCIFDPSEYQNEDSSYSAFSPGGRKGVEKKRTKTEKTISLQVLRQYFAGSLKDAAKSIGVCPTTLKRICRQHGITRWPSRKIKKVGHSLQKLQRVMDSVQGADGALQIGNFYSNYPQLNPPNISVASPFPPFKMPDQLKNLPQDLGSSSCSPISNFSLCSNTLPNQHNAMFEEDLGHTLKRACSDAELHVTKLEEANLLARSHSHKSLLGQNHHSPKILPPFIPNSSNNGFKVKVTFGEEKIRFSLHQNWGFADIQQEIARRFRVDDINKMDLKYLDDDSELVVLACDADLEECIDIYKSCQKQTIKLSVQLTSHPSLLGSSFGNNSLS